MTLKTIHGEPVRDIASAVILSAKEADYRRETMRLNRARMQRLGFPEHWACDCCRVEG